VSKNGVSMEGTSAIAGTYQLGAAAPPEAAFPAARSAEGHDL